MAVHVCSQSCTRKTSSFTRHAAKSTAILSSEMHASSCEVLSSVHSGMPPSSEGSWSPSNQHTGLRSRGQVDLIDFQSLNDREFKWLLVYVDHGIKFCQLVPMTSKRSDAVAIALLKIFTTLGAPGDDANRCGSAPLPAWIGVEYVPEATCTGCVKVCGDSCGCLHCRLT